MCYACIPLAALNLPKECQISVVHSDACAHVLYTLKQSLMSQMASHWQIGLCTPSRLLWVQCTAPEIWVAPLGPGHVRAQATV